MREYGKVYGTFWSSDTTGRMSQDGKLLALYLITCPHSTITGVFRLPDGYVAEDLDWSPERVRQGFVELLAKGFANRCETTKWVWILKHLDWNKPENPNQRKSAAKVALSIPDSCGWKLDFMRVWGSFLEIEWGESGNPSETVAEPLPNQKQKQKQKQKQEQKQEQEQDLIPAASQLVDAGLPTDPDPVLVLTSDDPETGPGPKFPPCPHARILALWKSKLPALRQPRSWEGARQVNLKNRWIQAAKPSSYSPEGYRTEAEGLAWWASFFDYIATGTKLPVGFGTDRPWRCDLEWVVNAANFQKIIDGKYDL